MIPPRFPVTEDQITRVVTAFYAAARVHPVLGPVFAAHVGDWPAHEAKIARFWANAILHAHSYDGNPLAVHRAAGDVKAAMFDDWLALFDRTLAAQLPDETARPWSALAHRIGRGLIYGLGSPAGPPMLR
jgi:hemoglobin